jgi:hypothetical protein
MNGPFVLKVHDSRVEHTIPGHHPNEKWSKAVRLACPMELQRPLPGYFDLVANCASVTRR